MSVNSLILPIATASRRSFIKSSGTVALSATAIALLAGRESLAQGMKADVASDVGILNVALGLEHEAIMAYQIGAESGLLQKGVLDIAVLFQTQHKEHAAALMATIEKLGGKPVASKSKDDYAKALNAASIKNQTDVIRLAAKLEKGAANAYLGVIPALNDKALAQVAARLAADETMHWTALAGALQEPLPGKALSFGA